VGNVKENRDENYLIIFEKKLTMKKLLAIILFFNFYCGFSQYNSNAPWLVNDSLAQSGKADINHLVSVFDQYWASRDRNKKGSGYKPFMRWEYHWRNMTNPQGYLITPGEMWAAFNEKNAAKSNRLASPNVAPTSNWEPIGPFANATPQSTRARGRVNIVHVDPSNPNTIYMGTPAGGIWKSMDAGINWQPMSDNLPQIGVSGIAVDYSNPNVIYISTGDKDNGDSYSIGVMKSLDGGATWNTTGLTFTNSSSRSGDIFIHPFNNQILWCATNTGIFKTVDGGNSWTNVRTGNFSQGSIRLKPGDPSIVYAVSGNRFFRSTDEGSTFTTITAGLPSNSGRLIMDVTPANSNYVYILSAATSTAFQGIYKSVDGGTSFVKTSGTTDIFQNTQAFYDLALAASSSNAEEIYTGCLNVWKSSNGGATVTRLNDWNTYNSRFTHADIHYLGYFGNNLYCGSDGGIYLSQDNGGTFVDKTGAAQIGQIYKIDVAKQTASKLVAGFQDNGGFGYSNTLWKSYHGGDGMDNAIDPTNSSLLYGFLYYGDSLFISNNGGTSLTSTVGPPAGQSGNWVTPLKANSAGEIFAGFGQLYRLNGSAWVLQSVSGLSGSNLELVTVDPSDDNIVYVVNGGILYKSTNKGINFNLLYVAPTNITSVAVHSSDSNILYLTTQGTSGQAYRSTNGGTSFSNFNTGLPGIGKNVIVHQGQNSRNPLYIGTSLGVYYRDDTLSQWEPFDTNLPNVSVTDLAINLQDEKLIASTYGRGVWQTSIPFEILQNDLKISQSQMQSGEIVCNGTYFPQVTIQNRGTNTINTITFDYQYNGTPLNFVWNGNLNSLEETTLDLPQIVTDSGAYYLNVTANISSDENQSNNQSSTLFYVNNAGTVGIANTFENGTPNLISYNQIGQEQLWEKGVSTKTLLNTVSPANQVYATNLSANYPDDTTAYLVSQCYNLTQVVNPVIKFNLAFDLQNSRDVLYMQYSTDFGINWETLGTASDINWYNSFSVPSPTGGGCLNCIGSQWSGRNLNFIEYNLPLNFINDQSNVIFRFVFKSNEITNYEGAIIDNFMVDGVLANQDFDVEKLAVYPNPSKSIFNVSFGNAIPKSIDVYDITGKILLSKNEFKNIQSNFAIDLTNAANGVYFLNFKTDNQSITKKIIKN
jgi:hypothetical protein